MAKEEKQKKAKSVSDFFKSLNKETGAEAFNESKLTEIEHYIDTGNYAVNRLISGDVNGGLPSGIISVWAAENSVGKTLQSLLIAKNAIEKNNYECIIYVDSEGGANRDMLDSVGIEQSKVQYVPVSTIEECTVKLLGIYKTITTFQETNPDFRALIILDSIGGLVPDKVFSDAAKDKQVQDMGLQSRLIGTFMRAVTMPAKKTNCGMIILSQLYDNPNDMYTKKIKLMRGGKSIWYQPSLIVQMSRNLEKADKGDSEYYESSIINYFTVKTRNDVRPFLQTQVVLDFKKGFSGNEYFGLIDNAIRLGFITQSGAYYTVPSYSDKSLRLSALVGGKKSKEIWDTFIDEFNKVSNEEISYKNLRAEDLDEIKSFKEEMKSFSLDFSETTEKD